MDQEHVHEHGVHAKDHEPSVKDPVCGMDVIPGQSKGGSYAFEGSEFHFCSLKCREKFQADPKKYLAPEAKPASNPAGVEYTCPMHPEIVRQGPGACPICGMALEPRAVSLDERIGETNRPAQRGRIRAAPSPRPPKAEPPPSAQSGRV